MKLNSGTMARANRGRLGIVAAGVVMAVTALAPASAFAAPAAGSASQTPADSTGGPIAATSNGCTSYWKWQANNYLYNGGYTQVEWTSNRCGFTIQERSFCNTGSGGNWSNSGIVSGEDIWDKSSCPALISYASRGEVHFNYQNGNGWTTYQSFWVNIEP
jgi:hypothetical protein